MLKDVVLRILNSTVGEYFEDIDASQFELSILRGDVALYDLKLKSNICETFGLPFRLAAGRCGTLTAKIPWTSLYSQPFEITLKDLYLLVVPGSAVPYDQELEETVRIAAKLKLIENIEAAQREIQQHAAANEDPLSVGAVAEEGYMEKLAMQILRNLQIQICNIHVRYEDDQTWKPFVVGGVLSELSILTTDAQWEPKYIVENVPTIHKLLSLDGLGLYWNSGGANGHVNRDYSTEEARVQQLRNMLLSNDSFDYMVGPIGTETKLKLTPNPEKGPHPFATPKIISDTLVHQLSLGVSNLQFQDILQLAESWDFLFRRQLHRKHRPASATGGGGGIKSYKGYYKLWWKFSYKCILEDIQRRRNNWRWQHIKQHRLDSRAYYSGLYRKTILKKPLTPDQENELSQLESTLDMFNLLLIRKQVDLCRERKEKEEAAAKKTRGWLAGWFGTGVSPGNDADSFIPEEMSAEEKAALKTAIGYSENALPVLYPPEFVQLQVHFTLDKLKLNILQDEGGEQEDKETILDMEILNFETRLHSRPVKNGLKLDFKLGSIDAYGIDDGTDTPPPHVISARNIQGTQHFIDLTFERSPLNTNLDQRLELNVQPLEITYDANTTQKLLMCFTLPQQVSLQRLQAKALSKYVSWKAHSTAGILRMVENRGKVHVDIHLMAPYIIIPQNGKWDSLTSNVLVIELGELLLKSKPPSSPAIASSTASTSPSTSPSTKSRKASTSAVLHLSYDSFILELRDFQVSLAFAGEVYRSSKTDIQQQQQQKESKTAIHLLKSGVVFIRIEQCLIPDDARFPRIKIYSSLPLVDFDIPEHRLMQLVNLIVTLPLPKQPTTEDSSSELFIKSQTELTEDAALNESLMVTQIAFLDMAANLKNEEEVQITALLVEVSIESIKIRVSRQQIDSYHNHRQQGGEETMLSLELTNLTANLTSKTFGTSVDGRLQGISLSAGLGQDTPPLYLIKTPRTNGDDPLIHVHIFTVTSDCPQQAAAALKVKQHVTLEVGSLEGTLHREVLITLVDFADQLTKHVAKELLALQTIQQTQTTTNSKNKNKKNIIENHTRALARKFASTYDPNDILLKVEAKLTKLTINVATREQSIMKLVMGNLNGSFVQKPTRFEIFLQLIQFNIINLDTASFYKKILTVDADRVMFVHVTKFEEQLSEDDEDVDKCDMKIKVETGSPTIHFLASFIVQVMNFSNSFQSATSAVKEASAFAAEAATQNVKKAYYANNEARISLDIQLRAPKLILPENDRSLAVLMFDFGNLKFSNAFSLVKAEEAGGRNAVVDEMEIAFQNVKVSRGRIDSKTQEAVSEILLLDPVTFTGRVRRNLSSDWFQGIPALSFNGKLHSTVVRLSSEDYEIVTGCIADKLNALEEVSSSSDLRNVKSEDSVTGLFALEQVRSSFDLETVSGLSLALDLSLNNLGIILYQGSSRMDGKKGLQARDPKTSLAELKIDSIVASASVTNSNNLKCSVTLGTVSLVDSRPSSGRRAMKNLIERRRGDEPEGSVEKPMIQFIAYQTPFESSVDLTTISLTILLDLGHLQQVTQFFKSSFNKDTTPPIDVQISKYKRKLAIQTVDRKQVLKTIKKTDSAGKANKASGGGPNDAPFKGNFRLEALELVFVESMDTIHTNAVLLNCEIWLSVGTIRDQTQITGKIEGVKLSTCNFNPEHRSQSLAEVISPTIISVDGSGSTEGGFELEVGVSDVFVRLSAGTVELLTKISESFTISAANLDELQTNSSAAAQDNSDIWDVKSLERQLWYLRPGAINAQNCTDRQLPEPNLFEDTEVTLSVDDDNFGNPKEKLTLRSGSIVLTFEAGTETITAPLLLVEAAFELVAVDWSLQLQLGGKIQVAAAYFNANIGIWEYLLEPVLDNTSSSATSNSSWRPLELLFSVNEGETDEFNSHMLRQSVTSLVCVNEPMGTKRASEFVCTLQCNSIMEFTISRTAVQVLTLLAETFNAARKTLVTKRHISTAPYLIANDTGMEILVDLTDTPFFVTDTTATSSSSTTSEVVQRFRLESGYELELSLSNDYTHYSILKEQQLEEDRWIRIAIQSKSFQTKVPVSKAQVRSYTLPNAESVTAEIWVKDCTRVVTFRGSIQILNNLTLPVDVLSKDQLFIATIQPNSRFNVPLTHSKADSLFFFAPAKYNSCLEPVDLQPAATNAAASRSRVLKCPNYTSDGYLYIKVISKSRQVMLENTNRLALNSINQELRLEPALLINNLLPVPIAYMDGSGGEELTVAEKGRFIQVTNLPPDAPSFNIPIRVKGYEGVDWDCRIIINAKTERLTGWGFVSADSPTKVLTLGVHMDESIPDQLILHIYAPFWMINRTGLNLAYKIDRDKAEVTRQPVDKELVLFSYPAADFFNKANKARVKYEEADWSPPFATETVGLSSFLTSKSATKNYQLGLTIKLSHGGLTKMLIFSPKFYLMNQCSYTVIVSEGVDTDGGIQLQPNLCVPFWPKGTDPRLTARIDGTDDNSKPFFYEAGHSTCLRLNNKFGGLQVDVNVGETRIVITFSEYSRGKAPNLFINATDDQTLCFRQEGQTSAYALLPGESQLISFPEPTESRTILIYPSSAPQTGSTNQEFKDTITADVYTELYWPTVETAKKCKYYWISFIEDLQRVTILTKDELLAKYLKTARDVELPSAELVILIEGLGLSLVDNVKCKEIIYLRISSWGVVWEEELSQGRLRPFPQQQSDALEAVYQNYVESRSERTAHYSNGQYTLDNGLSVDMKSMEMTKPHKHPISRCSKQPGFWSHIKLFPHSTQFHLKINRLQIDNQLSDASFVYFLSPVAQPKSVTTNISDGRKPFIEMVFMQGNPVHTISSAATMQFMYCSFLVQEFQVKCDMGLINALTDMFTVQAPTAKANKMMENFKEDYLNATESISEHQRKAVVAVFGSKRFYNYLHLSPLKVRVSFSMNGSSAQESNVLLLLLQGLGIDKLADFTDVPFQLACFELRSKVLSDDQLTNMVLSHYTTQGIKQFYVLILGLDFLGNPYALLTGISEGIGAFFYEPIQGAIQGPDAFREGLSLGVRSLVGHTVGGAAEAMSKVTGTIGKGFAAMTMDNEFQRKRNEAMRQGPQGTNFANTARGFFKTGLFDAVTGMVTNPFKGAQEDGLQGFGKGLLKGALGVLTRPVVGAADLARGTLDSFRRAVQEGDDLDQLRPPRPVQCTSALQPYSLVSGKGNQIIQELSRRSRSYLQSDTYVAHIVLNNEALLVTDRRAFFLRLTDQYGGCSVIWEHEWSDFAMPPYIVEKGLEFQLKNDSSRSQGMARPTPESQLYVPVFDPRTCMVGSIYTSPLEDDYSYMQGDLKWILDKLLETMATAAEA